MPGKPRAKKSQRVPFPKSPLKGGAQEGGAVIKLKADTSLAIGDRYPDPDKVSVEIEDREED